MMGVVPATDNYNNLGIVFFCWMKQNFKIEIVKVFSSIFARISNIFVSQLNIWQKFQNWIKIEHNIETANVWPFLHFGSLDFFGISRILVEFTITLRYPILPTSKNDPDLEWIVPENRDQTNRDQFLKQLPCVCRRVKILWAPLYGITGQWDNVFSLSQL